MEETAISTTNGRSQDDVPAVGQNDTVPDNMVVAESRNESLDNVAEATRPTTDAECCHPKTTCSSNEPSSDATTAVNTTESNEDVEDQGVPACIVDGGHEPSAAEPDLEEQITTTATTITTSASQSECDATELSDVELTLTGGDDECTRNDEAIKNKPSHSECDGTELPDIELGSTGQDDEYTRDEESIEDEQSDDHCDGKIKPALVLRALGVVFGDIGTSPLYALQTVFNIDNGAVKPTKDDVYGVVSMVFWSITVIVSIKYVGIVMRADNNGEGGVMALTALTRRVLGEFRTKAQVAMSIGVAGAALFYGDSLITPAISVLSAVEGLKVVAPSLSHLVLPIAVAILTVLFLVQRFGTGLVGSFFGPLMAIWFVILAATGIASIVKTPHVLAALSPHYLWLFVADHPYTTFVASGAVVLAITGAEALYADLGHFGRGPIAIAWFLFVFPALILNYLGQAALILREPDAVSNPFYLVMPSWGREVMVIVATMATIIASQAVISGAFSVTRQAMQLGYFPNMVVRQTSPNESGQIYIPVVNWTLFLGVLLLAVCFRSSEKLASAYGFAVTGALLVDTTLLLVVAHASWRWPIWKLVSAGIVFGGIELFFFSGNAVKIPQGGWLPLMIACIMFLIMTTWYSKRFMTARRVATEHIVVPVWRSGSLRTVSLSEIIEGGDSRRDVFFERRTGTPWISSENLETNVPVCEVEHKEKSKL